ncbi:hematopoietic progenitor cell antigen CD34 [Camarhynchus parvulus]|uniref:hematopoietic progenitor cell antigen CD34 n=1 Tax=Geospiza parvula TaxID=87175 RepID=UPI001237E85A|nr:hematopoietic progenitor cell antigen CD34 [Camarhynchus parvulus]
MEWGQLLCIFCLLELAGCAAGSTTATASPTGGASSRGTAGDSSATAASTATGDTSSTKPTSAAATASSGATTASSELLGQLNSSPQPSLAPTSLPGPSLGPQGSPGVPHESEPPEPARGQGTDLGHPQPRGRLGASWCPRCQHSPAHGQGQRPACHRLPQRRDEGDTGAVCLQLNESSTCERFLERKGLDLWQALCENRTHSVESPCEIKLTPSSLDRDCLLLILKGEKDPDKLLNTLPKSHWEKFGIESLQKESPRGRRDAPQRTLIALVTSGLLLALLGLAGCLLMRRRSWSPAGQRLAEDPYDAENGSQGNTMLMSPSQEPAELQEKPNLPKVNGGTQEKGTGPASSQNGHSGRQHRPADTEM